MLDKMNAAICRECEAAVPTAEINEHGECAACVARQSAKAETSIPIMDDPLGKYWRQPSDMTEVPFDDTHAILTTSQFRILPDYSRSTPTGVYPGKCWKGCTGAGNWYLCWFGADSGDGMLANFVRDILIVDETPEYATGGTVKGGGGLVGEQS